MIKQLAHHSYSIVKILVATILVVISLSSYFFKIEMSLPIAATVFFAGGLYVGYVIAYYSIKYLREENMKKKLPFN